jgi:hypothetical protein
MTTATSFLAIAALSSAFLGAHACHRFTIHIKRRWQALSAAVGMAYVFVNVLPELEEHRAIVAGSAMGSLLDADKRIYLWALAGFIVFSGLSRLRVVQHDDVSGAVYRGAMAGFGIYMFLIGYLLLHRDDSTLLSLWLFVFAMGLHIFMLDNQLAERFEGIYEPSGRLLLVSCLFFGWAMGLADALPAFLTSRLFAFVAGGVVITSAHEELGVEEGGRFWWFAGGAATYATLLVLI